MKTYKIIKTHDSEAGPEPRNAIRRYNDTDDRLFQFARIASSKRRAILNEGLIMLLPERDEETRIQVRELQKAQFNAQAHSHLITRPS